MVNIPSTCDDPQYRYKMPKLMSKKEGRGNGSKTCIVNMTDVARALKRPPQYTTKWFGSELGAQSTYTNKEGEGERAIVNGHHDTPIFQTMLDKFIQTYVLCQNCHLPEIDMIVKKGNIAAKCKACGWSGDLDNNHKLAAYIVKNPPDEAGTGVVNLAADSGGKKSKEERRKEREEKRKAKGEGGEDDDDDDDAAKEKKEKKVKKEKKEKKDKDGEDGSKEKKEKKSRKGDGEDGEGREKKEKKDKKEKGEKKEKKDRSERKEKKERTEKKASKDDDDSDEDEKEEDVVEYDSEIVEQVVGVMKEFASKGDVKPEDFFEELRMQQLAKLFDHKIRFYIALEALFPEGAMDAKAVQDKKKVLDKVLSAVKIPADHVLWGFNAYLSLEKNEKAVRSYPMVLKTIYDEEWASEAEILKYYVEEEGQGEPGFEKANTSAAPFLKWLQEAEESDDDDDSEEEDSD